MDAEDHAEGVQITNNNNSHPREEQMLVDLEDGGDHPAKLVADKAKWSQAAKSKSDHMKSTGVEEVNLADLMQETEAAPQNLPPRNFGQIKLEMLDDDSGDDDTAPMRKQVSSNVSDFFQSPSIFRRNPANESATKVGDDSKDEEQFEQTDSNETGRLHEWIEDVMEAISDPLLIKKDATAIADLCKVRNRPRLVNNKGQIKDHYGYEIDGTTYLWAEEALYLLETGKLDLFVEEIATSVERARTLLLHSKYIDATPESASDEILSCENDEYTVYKHFAKLGYRIRRRDSLRYSKQAPGGTLPPTAEGEVIDLDDEPIDEAVDDHSYTTESSSMMDDSRLLNPDAETATTSTQTHFVTYEESGHSRRGTKRKAGLGCISEDEEESFGEHSESAEDITNEGYTLVGDEAMEETETQETLLPESQYTVDETDDSDVEFVDEVIFSRSLVEIEELASNDPSIEDLENLPGPSTGQPRGPSPVILDLVSSSDSECEEVTNDSIWSNFTSVNTFEMKFPLLHLLPENIPARSDNRVYTLHNSSRAVEANAGAEEMEIDKSVDDLKLNSSRTDSRNSTNSKRDDARVKCTSWKEWRHLITTEARDVLNDSLLGRRTSGNNDINKKLNLWPQFKTGRAAISNSNPKLRIPFDLFPIVNRSVPKQHLWTKIQPMYHVAVVRTTDPVVSSHDMEAQLRAFNDNVPLLVALVDVANDVLVLSSDLKPLPSLF